MQHDLDILFNSETPDFVECTGGLKHIVLTPLQTHCGWRWVAGNSEVLRRGPADDPAARAGWCGRCLKLARA
eukprot:10782204-Heterocapsa_arctica.AAC.1